MNNPFHFSGDMFLKAYKHNRPPKLQGRKRRANSDSELSFMDDGRGFLSHLFSMPSDDIDIDIMGDTHSDGAVFSDDGTMDPSQMFIMMPPNPDTEFPYSPPSDALPTTTLDPAVTSDQHDVSISTSSALESVVDEDNLFHTQMYIVDTELPSTSTCLTTNTTQLTEVEVSGLYNVQGNRTRTSIHRPTNLGHIPAKFLKKRTVEQLTPKVIASQVNTRDGKDGVNQKWWTHKDEKLSLLETGCTWKTGMWSNDEEELLRNNIDNFCKKNSITELTSYIYSTPREDRKHFYRSISVGLNRPLFAVYRKVLRMYDEKNYVGKYTKEENEQLILLCEEYQNDWTKIGEMLGRSAASVKDRVRLMNSKSKKGKWSEEELQQLSATVHEMTSTVKGESVTTGINWAGVAEQMDSRSTHQCRTKWLHYLNWKEAGGQKWSKEDEIELINRVSASNAKEENEINWNRLANGWKSARSPQWLRHKWWNIKKHIPEFQQCSFLERMAFLQTTYINKIMEKVSDQIGDNLISNSFPTNVCQENIEISTLQEPLTTQSITANDSLNHHFPTYTFHIQLPRDQTLMNDQHLITTLSNSQITTSQNESQTTILASHNNTQCFSPLENDHPLDNGTINTYERLHQTVCTGIDNVQQRNALHAMADVSLHNTTLTNEEVVQSLRSALSNDFSGPEEEEGEEEKRFQGDVQVS